jgi:D-alanyl-D-alanine endopeptidase (penicillin-binding protein 7)
LVRLLHKIIFSGILFALFSNGANADPIPNVTAQAWLIADESGAILEGTQIREIRSIASITKLMTVMVVLDSGVSLTEKLPKKLYNKIVTRQDLIDMAIVKSDNTAAKMLCETHIYGYNDCIANMNKKAETLGMYRTTFVDPTGLFNDNVSTAEDLIKLVRAASTYPVIVKASNTDKIVWQSDKKNYIQFNNTNNLVGKGVDFIVSKTGWIRASGGCIVMMLDTVHGIRTVILLGSKNTKTRIPEAFALSKLL